MSDLVLVTGAAGFLGGHLTEALVEAGFRVRAFVRRPPKEPWLLHAGVDVHVGDLADPTAVECAVRGASVVYHVGATMSGSWEDYQQGTVRGTQHIVAACVKEKVRRLVHVSSVSVYDFAGLPKGASVSESWRIDPHPERRGDYARSKIEAEHTVRDAVSRHGLPAIIVRPGLIYGPRGPVMLSDVGRIVKERFLLLMGSGAYRLPLAYVANVVDALMRAADYAGPAGETFNVVDQETLTRREYIKSLHEVTGRRFVVLPVPALALVAGALACELMWPMLRRGAPAPLTRYRIHSLITPRSFGTSKTRVVLGWVPRIGVGKALEETWSSPAQMSAQFT
jgi:2-alkyl-3-oxoalkanoate reductase